MVRSVPFLRGRLCPPGSRKHNPHYLWRGSVNGKEVEFSCHTGNRADAQEYVRGEIQRRDRVRSLKTFGDVADMYMDMKQSSRAQRAFIKRLTDEAGNVPIELVREVHMAPVVRQHYSEAKASTINRQVIAPFAAIIHWAAEQDLCAYRPVRRLPEQQAARRAAPGIVGDLLMANTKGQQKALCALVTMQGWRLSDCLALHWEDLDLSGCTVDVMVPKSGRRKTLALLPEVRDALANLPAREGKVFTYADRKGVYRWWNPLVKRLWPQKVTPHQFRHAFAMDARQAALTDADIMEVGTWFDPKSVRSYSGTASERHRENLGKIRGKARK